MSLPISSISGLFVGKVETLWEGKPPSAINKQPVTGPLHAEAHGFVEDRQADLKVHGGAEKAIHHYAGDHMAFWQAEYPDHARSFKPGCFGENISTIGLTEENLCLGDILLIGNLRAQVCQGRQPCWKLNAHTGIDSMAHKFQVTGKTGWYYRVLEEGSAAVGDKIRVTERLYPDLPISVVTMARFNPRLDPATAESLSKLEALSKNWRSAFAKKADKHYRENTDQRLKGGH